MKIEVLKIYSNNIIAQADFYAQVIGLKNLSQDANHVTFKIGSSQLVIRYRAESTPYHFAINIPANKALEALVWLKNKVTILKDGDIEIQDFPNWNAEAMYFYDPDKNIVELIARKNLNNELPEEFTADQFLEISEIGLASTEIKKHYTFLNKLTGMEIYAGNFERFCAIGGEHGLFICINTLEKDWFPTGDKAFASAFEIQLQSHGKQFNLTFENETLSQQTT